MRERSHLRGLRQVQRRQSDAHDRRFVIGLIKHETNTFSPLPTPLSSFGHGEGPAFGEAARARFEHTNTPMAAYLDIARREHAQVVTPVAAEAWPSNKASRATFETLVASPGRRGARRLRRGAARPARRDGDRGLRRRRRRDRAASARHRAGRADRRHARLSHEPVGHARRQCNGDRRLQDLSARRHVRSGNARRRHPRRRARRRRRARDGLGLEAAHRVGDAPRAGGRAVRRHRSRSRGAWRPTAPCSPPRCCRRSRTRTRPTPACRRSSSATRATAAARTPRPSARTC